MNNYIHNYGAFRNFIISIKQNYYAKELSFKKKSNCILDESLKSDTKKFLNLERILTQNRNLKTS